MLVGNHVEPSFGSSIESPGEELIPHGGRNTRRREFYDSFVGGSTWLAGFGRYLRRGVSSAGCGLRITGRGFDNSWFLISLLCRRWRGRREVS